MIKYVSLYKPADGKFLEKSLYWKFMSMIV